MQSKKHSFLEAVTNTFVGFIISLVASFAIFPAVGIHTTPLQNLTVTIFYTIISIIRGYVLRRWFNKKTDQPKANMVDGPIFWLHCFHCETDMPVTEDKEVLFCSNWGLKH